MSNFESFPSEEKNLEEEEEEINGEPSAEIIPMEELALEEKEKEEKIPEQEPDEIVIEGINSPEVGQTPEQTEIKEDRAEKTGKQDVKPEEAKVENFLDLEQEKKDMEAKRIEELKAEIREEPEKNKQNLADTIKTETTKRNSIKSSFETAGGGGGGGGASEKLRQEMKKPGLLKRLFLALFGISWDSGKSEASSKSGGGGVKSKMEMASEEKTVETRMKNGEMANDSKTKAETPENLPVENEPSAQN